jgi:pilus assembly protein CpaB
MVIRKFHLLLLIVGFSLIFTAALMVFTVRDVENDAKSANELPHALTFTQSLQAGHILKSADLRWSRVDLPIPAGALIRGQKSELEIVGSILNNSVAQGELVREAVLFPKIGDASLAGKLNPGFRAVTISVDAAQLGSGRVLPNDRVDILLTPVSGQSNGPIPTPTMPTAAPISTNVIKLLDSVRILAISGATEPEKPETGRMDASILKDATVTLELRPDQAERVLASLALGKIALLLRRPNDFDAGGLSGQSPNLRVRPVQVPIPMTAPGQQAPSPLPGSGTGLGGQPQPTEPSVVIVRGSN